MAELHPGFCLELKEDSSFEKGNQISLKLKEWESNIVGIFIRKINSQKFTKS